MVLFLLFCSGGTLTCAQQQKQDTLVVSRDGTGKYRDIQEAVEAVRAFMDYTVTIYIKKGIYKEKLVIPSWVKRPKIQLLRMMTMLISIKWALSVLIQ